MNVLIILGTLFLALVAMVTLLARFGKPADAAQQAKYSKIMPILVFIGLFLALIRELI